MTYLILGEKLAWSKITYLKDWPEKYGSPFSKGYKYNLKYYCCEVFTNVIKEWKIPILPKNV